MASVGGESPLFLIPLAMVGQPAAADPEAEFGQLLDGIDAVHRYALGRLMGRLAELGGVGLAAQIAEDSMVRTLLEMYDLTGADERDQVEHALQGVYLYIESHGGRLELLDVEAGA